ncbi:hypothetical protein DFH07DRAFT_821748 [Mycena maculata]|uniref:DUF6593 domain-containing protein n=1 Tax=Mycena maculata TaxID=230809 RepID=A0AAD7J1W9_9AGAR|nr:hypothetical protein DFH07DRAFT_821748 [Mycena maculata]
MSSSSQATLADPSPPTCLVFERNSMLETTILRHASPVYRVSTNRHGSTTEVCVPGTHTIIARIVRKEILPDTVAFSDTNGGKAVRVSRWLKRTKQADGRSEAILETDIGACILRTHPDYRLALYDADLSTIVAHWAPLTRPPSPPTLVLAPGIERSQVKILVAFLCEEQKLRIAEKNSTVKAAAYRAKGRYWTAPMGEN